MKRVLLAVLLTCSFLAPASFTRAADEPATYVRKEVIYGRKFGTALTMDVFTPKDTKAANGAGVIFVVSGGWFSGHEGITASAPTWVQPFLDKGYAVFAVVHGSQPKFSIPEILDDLHRSVRFIKANAKEYGIDPDRLGIIGGSAGGHLALMQGCAGKDGDPKAKDPVEQQSSRVAAIAAFYPATDFLNWGEKGKVMLGGHVIPIRGAFDFRTPGPGGALVPVTDVEKVLDIGKSISPITHVKKDNPPTLIIHGDKDTLVPLQQAEVMVKAMKDAGATAELILVKGGGHDGKVVKDNMPKVLEWFDKHLAKKEKAAPAEKGK
jgi:acetyl esterase/lipase